MQGRPEPDRAFDSFQDIRILFMGRYDKIDLFHKGSICRLYRALDLKNNIWVTLKVLNTHIQRQGQEAFVRFRRETDALMDLYDANIVRI